MGRRRRRTTEGTSLRRGEVLAPRGDTVLQPDDELIAVVRANQQVHLSRLLRSG